MPARARSKPIVVTYPAVEKELRQLRRLVSDIDARLTRFERRDDESFAVHQRALGYVPHSRRG